MEDNFTTTEACDHCALPRKKWGIGHEGIVEFY